MSYNFNVSLKEGKWTVKVDTAAAYGYYEHDDGGEGGLWFDQFYDSDDKLELMDHDGFTHLPKDVATALRKAGFIVGPEFD